MNFSKPINSSIKLKVKTIFKSSKRKADKEYSENIKSKTKELDDFERLKIIDIEYESLKKQIKKSKYPFYIENSNSPDWVITQFASRTYLLNIDESKELEEAIFLGKYKDNLSDAIDKIKKAIPIYTYEKFINGEKCNYFLTFKKYRNLSEEDFYKIVKWQSENVINIISYESKVLIKIVQDYCKNIENPVSFIDSQNIIIDELFNNKSYDAKELKEILSKLIFFKDFDFNKFDDDLLLKYFAAFANEEFHWHNTDYNIVKPIADFLRLKPTYFFSNEIFVFESINKVSIWFKEILEGKSIQEEYKYFDYKKEIERVQLEAKQEIENISSQIDAFIYDENNSEKEVKSYFLKLYESNRVRFNNIKHKDIMHMLNDDKKHLLINYFTTNAFFGNNVKKVAANLKEVIIVQEVAWDIFVTHNEFFKAKMVYDFIDSGVYEIITLLNQMVLNKKLYKATRKAQLAFFTNFQRFSLPFDYHFIDIQTEMRNVFSIALKNLQEFLDDAEPTNKIIYLQSRIKEIKQRELLLKQYEDEYEFNENENKYTNLFKEFLLIETDFIKETINIPRLPILEYQAPKQLGSVEETFENITNEINQTFILKMMEDLCITLNGKSIISERKKGAIRGIVEALKQNNILPNRSIDILSKIIGKKIDLVINSKLDFSDTSENYKKEANKYITNNYSH
jgi:hypothetical protein